VEPDFRLLWSLDPNVRFLNHGSYGACPKMVLATQLAYRAQMEAEPVRFFGRELEPLLDGVRRALGDFIGARADNLALVRNATNGVNTVLRSLRLAPGDQLLVTDHAYNACRNALDQVAEHAGAATVLINMNRGAMPQEMFMEQIQRFGAEVLPALQAHRATVREELRR